MSNEAPLTPGECEHAETTHQSPLTTHPGETTHHSLRGVKWVLRGALGVGTLVYLYRQVGGAEVAAALRAVDLPLWVAAVALYLVGQALCALKWGVLAAALGMRRPYRALLAYYFGGMFANLFLPTIVGGDVGRALAVSRPDSALKRGLVTVLADRGSGFVALLLLAGAAALAMPELPAWLRLSTLGGAALALAGSAGALLAPGRLRGLGGAPAETLAACRRPGTGVPVLLLSLLFQALIVVAHALLGRALGLSIAPGYYALAGTLVAIVAMAPISINGVGTRDAAYVFFFGLAGVPREAALAFALAWLALLAVCGAVGGVLFALLAPGEMEVWKHRSMEIGK